VAVMKCMRPVVHDEINTTEAACLRMTVLKRSGRIISVSVVKAGSTTIEAASAGRSVTPAKVDH
jgi:hypothetical protein